MRTPYIILSVLLLGTVAFIVFSFMDGETGPKAEIQTDVVSDTPTPAATNGSVVQDIAAGEAFDVSNQGLTQVPQETFQKSNLSVLDLSHNNLSGSLPGEIRFLQELTSLDLSDNNFTGVPAEIGQLKKLEVLDLSNNPITGLPYELGDLTNLRVLDLRGTNYAPQDLEIIKKGLSDEVDIRID